MEKIIALALAFSQDFLSFRLTEGLFFFRQLFLWVFKFTLILLLFGLNQFYMGFHRVFSWEPAL